jgi:hypothetical protein
VTASLAWAVAIALGLAAAPGAPPPAGAGADDPASGDARAAPTPGWRDGASRPFLALQADLGTTEHLRAVAGWGKPWWLWGGLLADGWLNDGMGSVTAGARVALLVANLDVHWRTTRSWSRVAMAPAARHEEVAEGGGSTLHAWDLAAWGVVPTRGGYLTWEGQAMRLLGLSRDVHVYEEALQAIVRPPWAGLVALGWVADLARGSLQVGGSADLTFLGRGDARRVRAGPSFSWSPSPRWTVKGQLLVPLSSPDALPFRAGLGGGLTVGCRIATGTRR